MLEGYKILSSRVSTGNIGYILMGAFIIGLLSASIYMFKESRRSKYSDTDTMGLIISFVALIIAIGVTIWEIDLYKKDYFKTYRYILIEEKGSKMTFDLKEVFSLEDSTDGTIVILSNVPLKEIN